MYGGTEVAVCQSLTPDSAGTESTTDQPMCSCGGGYRSGAQFAFGSTSQYERLHITCGHSTITDSVSDTITDSVSYTITYSVSDNITGSVSDNITGSVSGTITYSVSDTITGSVSDTITDSVSDTCTGNGCAVPSIKHHEILTL